MKRTMQTDVIFVAQVRAALAGRVRSIVDEAGRDAWGHLQHRQLAERIKALVAAWRGAIDPGARDEAPTCSIMPSGSPSGCGNCRVRAGCSRAATTSTPRPIPPSASTISPTRSCCCGARSRRTGRAASPDCSNTCWRPPPRRWPAAASTRPTTAGSISAALARLHRLRLNPRWPHGSEQWLAEGIDIDETGSTRSAAPTTPRTCPTRRCSPSPRCSTGPDLVDAVERNLDATLDLLLPDGSVETVHVPPSGPAPADALPPTCSRCAGSRCCAAAATWPGRPASPWRRGSPRPRKRPRGWCWTRASGRLCRHPVRPERPRQRVFASAGLLMDHRPATNDGRIRRLGLSPARADPLRAGELPHVPPPVRRGGRAG